MLYVPDLLVSPLTLGVYCRRGLRPIVKSSFGTCPEAFVDDRGAVACVRAEDIGPVDEGLLGVPLMFAFRGEREGGGGLCVDLTDLCWRSSLTSIPEPGLSAKVSSMSDEYGCPLMRHGYFQP